MPSLELFKRARMVSADLGSLKCTQIVNISMGYDFACLGLYVLCQPEVVYVNHVTCELIFKMRMNLER